MVDTENISHFSWCKASHRRVSHSLPLLVPLYQLVAVPPARHQPFSLCHFANTGLGIWSWRRELNPQPALYKSAALPVELHQHINEKYKNFPLYNFISFTSPLTTWSYLPTTILVALLPLNNLFNKDSVTKKIWWAGEDSNLRHPAPKAIWKSLFNCFSRVDYFTALFQLSYPPIFNWWGEMGSNHPSVIRIGFTDRTASTYGISPHNSGFWRFAANLKINKTRKI